MAEVSVILIAYNVEQYVREAVESVLNQTMKDIELLCVDDCSTDKTSEILTFYAQRDPRVRILRHNENRGMAAARHTGVLAATGRYVMFLDGDDALLPNACAFLCCEMQRQKVELLGFNTILQPDSQMPPSPETLHALNSFLRVCRQYIPQHNGELLETCFCEQKMPLTIWNKIYTRELITKAYSQYHDERLLVAEDVLIAFMVLLHARSYGYTDQAFYRYRVGSGSTTAIVFSEDKMKAFAPEYTVWNLLRQWLTPEQQALYAKPLQVVRTRIINDIFDVFLNQAPLSDCSRFLELLLQYYPLQEFIADLVEQIYTHHICTPTQAIERLRNCKALVPAKRPLRTIGTFYFRMNNGGIERVISLLVPIWIAMGYRVVVITEQPPCEQDYILPEGVERAILPPVEGDAQSRLANWYRLIDEYQIDTMVYHAWVHEDLILDELAVRSAGIPFLLYAHGLASTLFEAPYVNPFLQEVDYSLCSRILAMSDVDCAWWKALGLSTHLVLNPPTYAVEQIEPSPLDNHDAIWIGRLAREKQYHHAFDIAKLVHDAIPDFRLRVVGTTETPEELCQITEYLKEHKMTDYVLLEGFHSDPSAFYREASVHLCTSLFEGFAMIFGESKIFGLPLVTYELPNLYFTRQEQGMCVVPQGNIRMAADRIIQILSDDELRRALGQQARASMEKLTVQDVTAQWANVFSTLYDTVADDIPLYRQPALDVAVRLAMRTAWNGKEKDLIWSEKERLQQENERLRNEKEDADRRNAVYAESINELTHSTIFRIGRIITWPLRKLKNLLR